MKIKKIMNLPDASIGVSDESMTTNSKKYLVILLSVMVAGFGIFFINKKDNAMTGNSSLQNNLYPEQSITHSHGLAVDLKDSTKLYIATHHGLLLLQDEKKLYRIGKSNDDYMGFSPHSTDPNILFSSGHPSWGGNIGFQKSEDGGITWKKISDGINGPVDFHAMTVSPVNPNLMYGWYQGNLQRSIDQGKTWEIVNRDLLVIYLAADTQDENTVYAASPQGQGILVSRDGGKSWTSLSEALEHGAVSTIALQPKNSRVILTFSEALKGLGKSNDAGKTWKKVEGNFGGETILHIAFNRNNPNIVYALGHENGLYKSADAGDTWNKIK